MKVIAALVANYGERMRRLERWRRIIYRERKGGEDGESADCRDEATRVLMHRYTCELRPAASSQKWCWSHVMGEA